jgi:hypothetical protein
MAKLNPRLKVQKIDLTSDSLRLKTPFCMSISGPSQGLKFIKLNLLIL